MSLTDTERLALAAVADIFLPATDAMPAASEAGVADEGVDAVLDVAPSLAPQLRDALRQLGEVTNPAAALADLQQRAPTAYDTVRTVCGAAYYLDAMVRSVIGYPGQAPTASIPGNDTAYLDEALLDHVAARGPRFRPAP